MTEKKFYKKIDEHCNLLQTVADNKFAELQLFGSLAL